MKVVFTPCCYLFFLACFFLAKMVWFLMCVSIFFPLFALHCHISYSFDFYFVSLCISSSSALWSWCYSHSSLNFPSLIILSFFFVNSPTEKSQLFIKIKNLHQYMPVAFIPPVQKRRSCCQQYEKNVYFCSLFCSYSSSLDCIL